MWAPAAMNGHLSACGSAMAAGERRWDMRVGNNVLRVPQVRDGSYFPKVIRDARPFARADNSMGDSARAARAERIEERNAGHCLSVP